ncbi:MAG: SGNH/GDSL hydrolase family protein [Dehalococcoidia bacterium]|nr:SGNH/GDSL hydrolase family protein [Dehalococcoidia bacterium]
MKNILCFGDSNTWGYEPLVARRYPTDVRWTGVLQKSLGSDYRVIEEGLNGRTTFISEDERPLRSGSDVLPILLESHRPLDLAIIMLGTNDLKLDFNLTVAEIAQGAKTLCELVMNSEYLEDHPPEILLISPTHIGHNILPEDKEFFIQAREKSLQFAEHYEKAAAEAGVHFLDAAKVAKVSEVDGVHWDASQHKEFGELLSGLIQKII